MSGLSASHVKLVKLSFLENSGLSMPVAISGQVYLHN